MTGPYRTSSEPCLAADLEAAVRELVLGDDDGHPRVPLEVLELAVAGGHPEGEAAVLPDEPERRQEDRPVLPDGGQGRQPALVEEPVQLLDG